MPKFINLSTQLSSSLKIKYTLAFMFNESDTIFYLLTDCQGT